MPTFHPYFNFNGNTEEAFSFYKSVFGGEFTMLQRFGEMPDADKMLSEDRNKLMHIALPIGGGTVLMGTDLLESAGHEYKPGNTISISIAAETKEEADRLFTNLSADGKIEMDIQDTFWGAYFGMFTDKYGIQWMVNYDHPKEN